MRFTSVAAVALLLAAVSSASALSLGRVQGAALIGQPLELLVPVTIEAGQDSALCADADVFHGETRIENSRVQVRVEPTSQADTVHIRVASPTLVDEPVVTVYVRAGCSQKTSRRFVLLADFPSDSANLSTRSPLALLPPTGVAPTESPSKSGWASANETTATTPTPTPTPTPAKAASAEKPVPAPPPKVAASAPPAPPAPIAKKTAAPAPQAAKAESKNPAQGTAKAPASAKARLQLDPLENLAERVKSLESVTVAAPPSEAAGDAQQMQQLQRDIKALLSQAAKNESNLMAMRERLEKAESERVPMFVVYALLALLGLCVAGLVFLWSRRTQKNEREAPFYATVTAPSMRAAALEAGNAPAKPAATVSKPDSVAHFHPDPSMDVDVNLMDMDDSSFSKLMEMGSDAKKTPTPNAEPR